MHLIIFIFALPWITYYYYSFARFSLLYSMTRTFCFSFDKNGMHRINIHQIRLLGAHTYRINVVESVRQWNILKIPIIFLFTPFSCWLEILIFLRAACLTTWKKCVLKYQKTAATTTTTTTKWFSAANALFFRVCFCLCECEATQNERLNATLILINTKNLLRLTLFICDANLRL